MSLWWGKKKTCWYSLFKRTFLQPPVIKPANMRLEIYLYTYCNNNKKRKQYKWLKFHCTTLPERLHHSTENFLRTKKSNIGTTSLQPVSNTCVRISDQGRHLCSHIMTCTVHCSDSNLTVNNPMKDKWHCPNQNTYKFFIVI